MYSYFPHSPRTYTHRFLWAMALGATHREERRLTLPPGVLRLGRGTEVTTCFLDMSVAVNRAEGVISNLEGDLVYPWWGIRYPAPFQAQEQS